MQPAKNNRFSCTFDLFLMRGHGLTDSDLTHRYQSMAKVTDSTKTYASGKTGVGVLSSNKISTTENETRKLRRFGFNEETKHILLEAGRQHDA